VQKNNHDSTYISAYITDKKYKFDEFNSENYNKFFLNDFFHNVSHRPGEEQFVEKGFGRLDLDGEYVINKFGYRSKPFGQEAKVVFSGDSFTYGVGLPEEGIWSSMVGKNMGLDFVNLGWPGASAQGVVSDLMHYFKVYGNPEYLFCMFPDLERIHLFLNKNIMMSASSQYSGFQEVQLGHISDYSERPKYSSKPYMAQDVFSNETAYYYSLKAIQFLEQYCNQSGIKFLWSIFHQIDHDAVLELKDNEFGYYSNFIDTRQMFWQKDENFNDFVVKHKRGSDKVLCHEEYRDIHKDKFDLAGDIEEGRTRAHFGVHRHIHTAEIFTKEIERLNENSWNQ
jgi:hypothetical protein